MTSDLKKQAKALRTRIEAAFADVPYPGDENLYDGGQRDDDYDDMIAQLSGKHWRDLIPERKPPRDRANPLANSMTFCSPAAWRFYLPAYLIIDIIREEIRTYPFDPAQPEGLKDYTEERFGLLNAEQCEVIALFLGFAEALLDKNQKKFPNRETYFKAKRQRVAAVIAYWTARSAALARLKD